MKKLALIIAVFISVALGEQVLITKDAFKDMLVGDISKNGVVINVKGNNRAEVGKEVVAGCIKQNKKHKARVGAEIKYEALYLSDREYFAVCKFINTYERDNVKTYIIELNWIYEDVYQMWQIDEYKNTNKLKIDLKNEKTL
ncbi:hypothetical protein ACWIUD_09725 [Helicobacter sp. 23-1044]